MGTGRDWSDPAEANSRLTRIAQSAIPAGVVMARSKTGEAIGPQGRSPSARKKLRKFIQEREKGGNFGEWRRGKAILGYIEGQRVVDLAAQLDVTRGSINRWLQGYEAAGIDALKTRYPPGPTPKLNEDQRAELTALVEAGSIAAGYHSGVWTGPMVGDLIEQRFGVRYHKHNVPRLLHELGFSLQRPRKRLAHADLNAQATWLRETLPAVKKSESQPRSRDSSYADSPPILQTSTPSRARGRRPRNGRPTTASFEIPTNGMRPFAQHSTPSQLSPPSSPARSHDFFDPRSMRHW
ncbi:MAG: IS630 family transposase [Myxococcales bacterium]|nr:IS630 family transposase [Myxococcales bacterium]